MDSVAAIRIVLTEPVGTAGPGDNSPGPPPASFVETLHAVQRVLHEFKVRARQPGVSCVRLALATRPTPGTPGAQAASSASGVVAEAESVHPSEFCRQLHQIAREVEGIQVPLMASARGALGSVGTCLLTLADFVLVADEASFRWPGSPTGVPRAAPFDARFAQQRLGIVTMIVRDASLLPLAGAAVCQHVSGITPEGLRQERCRRQPRWAAISAHISQPFPVDYMAPQPSGLTETNVALQQTVNRHTTFLLKRIQRGINLHQIAQTLESWGLASSYNLLGVINDSSDRPRCRPSYGIVNFHEPEGAEALAAKLFEAWSRQPHQHTPLMYSHMVIARQQGFTRTLEFLESAAAKPGIDCAFYCHF